VVDRDILDAVQRRIVGAERAEDLDAAEFWVSVLRHLIALSAVLHKPETGEQVVQAAAVGATLGSLIRIDGADANVLENDWIALVEAIAGGDRRALDALYVRTCQPVFTLMARTAPHHPAIAEELTLDVFRDVWRRASTYRAERGSVVGWIMNQARSRAIDLRRVAGVGERSPPLRPKRGTSDVLRPPASLRKRLGRALAAATGGDLPLLPAIEPWAEPEWVEVGPGISYKLLSADPERSRVSMLVRLAPGADYPAHRHAGVEELHLLHGELRVDRRKLQAGDYLRSEPGSVDHRVWSETGCTCVLMTSTGDALLK
jgi:quercetin dioxygenase-like cupin family protein